MRRAFSGRVVTCDPEREGPLGVIEDGVVVIEDETIAFVGPRQKAPGGAIDAGGVITPGLVDAHTHSVWAGSRHLEYAVRMAGGDYRDIAKAGGGIVSTHAAVRDATFDALAKALAERLARMSALGVTTVEVKSGYGLLVEHERKQLEAIARVRNTPTLPRVVPTYLALHAVPPNVERATYVKDAIASVKAMAKLASFVDAYVDPHAFTVDEARALGHAAHDAGLAVRMHVGQFGDVGGAELAAELGAKSVDHVEHVSKKGIEAVAKAGTSVVLLPVASFTLAQKPPPVADFEAAGISLVVASDANPGTAPTESLPLAMALAVRSYGLTPEKAILAATRNAAATLDCDATGMLRVGDPADLVVWDLPHEIAIVQPWGTPKTRLVLRDGQPL